MASIEQLVNRIRAVEMPILALELRVKRRKQRNSLRVLVYGTLLLTGFIATLAVKAFLGNQGLSSPYAMEANQLCAVGTSALLLLAVAVAVPGLSATSVVGEHEKGTFDLLAMTLLPSYDIVAQKLLVSIAGVLAMMAASVPGMTVIGLLGGLSPLDLVLTYLIMVAAAVFVGTMGVYWSCMLPNSRTATFVTYCGAFLYVVSPSLLPGMMGMSFMWLPFGLLGAFAGLAIAIVVPTCLAGRAGRSRFRANRAADVTALVVGLGLVGLLMSGARLVRYFSFAVLGGPMTATPLSTIQGLVWSMPDIWVSVLATLGFMSASTALLFYIAVRRLESLRRG